jgi:hypothetical protein
MYQNFRKTFWFHCFIAIVPFLFLNGCGGIELPDGMPKLYPVTITITQEGKPLEGASVALISEDPSMSQWVAGGLTDASGNAVIKTLSKYKGAASGKYLITIVKQYAEPNKTQAPNPATDPEGYGKYLDEIRRKPADAWDLIDPRYSTGKSPESIEVVKGRNKKTIEVGAAVKIKRAD